MPRGISQEQVDQAADAIVASGERPTVEKVRAHLGTGSPNTVTRMLDTWRQGLAERLREANQLPGLPDDVGRAMSGLWALAAQHAREHVQSALQSEHEALEQAKAELEAESVKQAALLAAARSETAKSAETAREATTQAEMLQRLVQRLETEIRDHAAEHQRLATQNETLLASEAKLRDQLGAAEARSAREREARDQHVRTVEDRAHTQVDRARVDLKAVRSELDGVRRLHHKEQQAMQQQIADLAKSLSVAEREASRQRGIAEALTLQRDRSRPARVRKPASKTSAATKRRANTRRG